MEKVNNKAIERLRKWLDDNDDKTFIATKIKSHDPDKWKIIGVGERFVGDALLIEYSGGAVGMSFGRGIDSRMWTSQVFNARRAPKTKNVWLVKTKNSVYRVEIK